MSDTTITILESVIAKLKADAPLVALVGTRIYSYVPQNPTYPFCFVSISGKPENTFTTSEPLHKLRVQAFSTYSGTKEALDIRDAIYNEIERNTSYQQCTAQLRDLFLEPDGKTYQSVIEFDIN